jgi:hypothetical protein
MRRIKSEKELEAKRKRMQLMVGVVMIGLLVLATAGWFASEMFGGNSENFSGRVEYGGRTYLRQNNVFILEMENKYFYFFNLPNESRGIYLNYSSFADYSGKPLYIVNPVSEAQMILSNLEGVYSRWQTACLEDEECEGDLFVTDCSRNVIAFFENNETKVERKGNCVLIYGNFEKGVDAFSYSLLNIK